MRISDESEGHKVSEASVKACFATKSEMPLMSLFVQRDTQEPRKRETKKSDAPNRAQLDTGDSSDGEERVGKAQKPGGSKPSPSTKKSRTEIPQSPLDMAEEPEIVDTCRAPSHRKDKSAVETHSSKNLQAGKSIAKLGKGNGTLEARRVSFSQPTLRPKEELADWTAETVEPLETTKKSVFSIDDTIECSQVKKKKIRREPPQRLGLHEGEYVWARTDMLSDFWPAFVIFD